MTASARIAPRRRTAALLSTLALIGGTIVLWRYLQTYPVHLGDGGSEDPDPSAALRLSLHLWMLGVCAIVATLSGTWLFRQGQKRWLAALYGLSLGLGTLLVTILYVAMNAAFLRTTPAAERVFKTSGMILNPRYYEPVTVNRGPDRAALGLDPDRPTAIMMFALPIHVDGEGQVLAWLKEVKLFF